MTRWTRGIVVLLAGGLAVWLGVRQFRSADIGAVQRGYQAAEAKGCFTCHGSGGHRGMPNPGYSLEDIPPWSGGMLMMYANDEAEIREWIEDGMPKRIRENPEEMKGREKATLRMPAFRERLSERELADLVAYVKAVADFDKPDQPEDAKAEEGRQVAVKFGCFNCHGPQGRGAPSNAGSFKGYIPGWDGHDFAEITTDDAEAREWILDGRSKRFREDRFASFFLDRANVKMPAYRGQITDEEVALLLDYIRWLRMHTY